MYARKRRRMTEKDKKDIESIISKALSKTITALRRIYNDGKGIDEQYKGSHLIFPANGSDEQTRISEQELRFVFAEKLSSICKREKKYWYSVETPTKEPYRFSDGQHNKIDPVIGEGQSGNFDMAIHDGSRNKLCFIEFKAGESVSKQAFMEVLAKLANPEEREQDSLRYIIHMVKDKRSNQCAKNLEEAINWLPNADGMHYPTKSVNYICFSLNKRERKIDEPIKEITEQNK